MIKATISRSSLRAITEGVNKDAEKITRMTQEQLKTIVKSGKEYADNLLNTEVKYDGPLDEVGVTAVWESNWKYTLMMYGPGATIAAIEYGATSHGPHEYYFFSGKGQKIALKAGGHKAYYTRLLRNDAVTQTNRRTGKQTIIDISNEKWYDRPVRQLRLGKEEKKYRAVRSQADPNKIIPYALYKPEEGQNYGVGYEKVTKKNSYYTKGNPPNNVIKKTFEHMADEVSKL